MAAMDKAPAASAWGIYLERPTTDQKVPKPTDAKTSAPPQQREATRPAATLPATGAALIWYILCHLKSPQASRMIYLVACLPVRRGSGQISLGPPQAPQRSTRACRYVAGFGRRASASGARPSSGTRSSGNTRRRRYPDKRNHTKRRFRQERRCAAPVPA